MSRPARRDLVGVFLIGCLLAACAPAEAGSTVVQVDLSDFSVSLDRTTVPGGAVTFAVSNAGPSLHEIEIFAGGTDGEILDVSTSVADTTSLQLVDEVEDILDGGTARLTVDLEPGTYLIVCNLPDHYAKGMSAYLTVEG